MKIKTIITILSVSSAVLLAGCSSHSPINPITQVQNQKSDYDSSMTSKSLMNNRDYCQNQSWTMKKNKQGHAVVESTCTLKGASTYLQHQFDQAILNPIKKDNHQIQQQENLINSITSNIEVSKTISLSKLNNEPKVRDTLVDLAINDGNCSACATGSNGDLQSLSCLKDLQDPAQEEWTLNDNLIELKQNLQQANSEYQALKPYMATNAIESVYWSMNPQDKKANKFIFNKANIKIQLKNGTTVTYQLPEKNVFITAKNQKSVTDFSSYLQSIKVVKINYLSKIKTIYSTHNHD